MTSVIANDRGLAKPLERAIGFRLERIDRQLAYFGGFILAIISIVTVVSIIGRALLGFGFGPIKGDFEIVENGCAIAVFAFLPLAQLRRGHVTVDIFVQALPLRVQAFLGLLGDVLLTIAAFLILWRLYLGFGEKFPYGSETLRHALGMGAKPFFPETTYELEVPVWIPYSLALIGAFFFFVTGVYTVWRSLNWTIAGQEGA